MRHLKDPLSLRNVEELPLERGINSSCGHCQSYFSLTAARYHIRVATGS
jgi:hypothetical protein